MLPVIYFAKQYIRFINLNGKIHQFLLWILNVLCNFPSRSSLLMTLLHTSKKNIFKSILVIKISIDLGKKAVPPKQYLVFITFFSYCFFEGGRKAELFPVCASLGHADGWKNGQILAPMACRFVSAWGLEQRTNSWVFPITCVTLLYQKEKVKLTGLRVIATIIYWTLKSARYVLPCLTLIISNVFISKSHISFTRLTF